MSSLIVQRLLRGFGANLYGQAVVIIIQLAGVPILLQAWGTERYGEWLFLFAIPAYLSITDLGFSISAANDMTARTSRGDLDGVLVVFQSLNALVFVTVLFGFGVASLVIATVPLDHWLRIASLSMSEVRWVLWLLAIAVLVNLAEGINHAAFRANGDYALHVGINYSTLFVQHASVWIVAVLGYGPVFAAAAFAFVRSVATPLVAVLLVRRYRAIHFGFGKASVQVLRGLLKPAMANTAMPLAQAINIQGMVLVVGSILGPTAVVVFTTLRTLTRVALYVVTSISHVLEPELAAAWGAADGSLRRTIYLRGLGASFWLGLGAVMGLLTFGGWFVQVWTNGRIALDPWLYCWLMLSVMLTALWHGSLSLLKAANRHLRAAFWFVLSAVGAVMFATLLLSLTKQLAYSGFALVAMDISMTLYLLGSTSRLLTLSPQTIVVSALDPRPFWSYARVGFRTR